MLDSKFPKKISKLFEFFSPLNDPRRAIKGNFIYPFNEILFLSLTAVLSGCDGWTSIAMFGESKLEWLRNYLPFKNGTPSHDVLGKLFSIIDPLTFNECFIQWVNSLSEITQGEVIAIDGKTIRGSGYKNQKRSPFHVVSAYAAQNRICMGQYSVSEKSNEITAIPKLLDMLDVTGCIVTTDAMGCQRDIARKIIDKNANYILMVKDNQKNLNHQIEKVFDSQNIISSHLQNDVGHGRVESRHCDVIQKLTFLDGKENWAKLNSIVRIKSTRFDKQTQKSSNETRYYISSLKHTANQFNNHIRQHWAVENNLHWSLDVIFGEDDLLIKKGHAPINFSMIQKMALSMLEKEKSTKMSKPSKRLKAALDDNYRTFILNS